MMALATQLQYLGDFISEQEIHLAEIIPYFYLCFNYEDIQVIKLAIKSLRFLAEKYKFKHESIIALGKKLFQTKYPKSMVSSVLLCCELVEYIPSKYGCELSKIVGETATSENHLIRRHTAYALRFIMKEKSPFVQLATQSLVKMIEDPQDTVKVYAAQSLAFHKHSKTFFMKNIYPLVQICLNDSSWRVKYAILENFENILLSTQNGSRKPFLDFYLDCLKSTEEEVVIQAYGQMKKISNLLESDFLIQSVLPLIEQSVNQKNEQIRIQVASALPFLAPSIGKNAANKQLKDLLMEFLKDSSNNVKIEIFDNLEPLDSVIPLAQFFQQSQEVLNGLLNEQQWKVRDRAVKTLKIIFQKMDDQGQRNPQFLNLLQSKLQDRVFQVRKSSLNVLKDLCKTLGPKWSDECALVILQSFQDNINYLYRMNYLFGMGMIYEYLSPNVFEQELLGICKMAKDQVPNVRMNVLRTLLIIFLGKQNEQVEDKISKIVSTLEKDEDHYISSLVKKVQSSSYLTAAQAIVQEDYI